MTVCVKHRHLDWSKFMRRDHDGMSRELWLVPLRTCPFCLRAFERALTSLPLDRPSAGFVDRVMDGLERQMDRP